MSLNIINQNLSACALKLLTQRVKHTAWSFLKFWPTLCVRLNVSYCTLDCIALPILGLECFTFPCFSLNSDVAILNNVEFCCFVYSLFEDVVVSC